MEEKTKEKEKKAFEDAVWYGKFNELYPSEKITIVGAGGTGSWTSLFLSRMECPFNLFDGDVVEERNLSGQFFKIADIGLKKTTAVIDNCKLFTVNPENMRGLSVYYSKDYNPSKIMFSCVDSFKARRLIYNSWRYYVTSYSNSSKTKENLEKFLFIDMRLELELLQVYVVTPDRFADYEKTLKSDEEVPSASCTLKQTTHNAAMIAAIAVNQFNNFISNLYSKNDMRSVEFFTEYFTPLNSFTYEK